MSGVYGFFTHGRLMWVCWAGLAPGLVCLIATPLILYVIYPPEQKDTPDAPEKARWVRIHPAAQLSRLLQALLAMLTQRTRVAQGSGFLQS